MLNHIQRCFLAFVLLGLPLLGVVLSGLPLRRYLEFPPETRYVEHAPFSWPVFGGYGIFILAVTGPLVLRSVRSGWRGRTATLQHRPFPWWGWLGFFSGLLFWVLAWTRFSWFIRFQPHTFTPLWLSFILTINALTYRRNRCCLMTVHPTFFLLLFPYSTIFWWFFEYLNRFVQNWYYIDLEFSAGEYALFASLSFSTVLPAVMSTRKYLLTFPWIHNAFKQFVRIEFLQSRRLLWVLLLGSSAGLFGTGIWPDYLFSLLWLSPLFIIFTLSALTGESQILSALSRGDWRDIVSSALAALVCGLFWEMWNYFSLAKWEYSVPFVNRFLLFEMPILGYAGYLPFGIECAVVSEMLVFTENKILKFRTL